MMIKRIKFILINILTLSSLLVTGCSIHSAATHSAATRVSDIYANACPQLWSHKVAADVRGDLKVNLTEQKRWDIFNDEPTAELLYQGTTGYVTQNMQAIARAPECPFGATVVLKRPNPSADRKFNKDSFPPGLHFAGPNSTTIEGVPTRSGQFTTTVLLCGKCKTAQEDNWYPVVGKIKWVIKGHSPKRIE
jgi:hypothetical protein